MKRLGTNPYDLPSVWDLDDEMEWAVQDLIPLSGITLFCAHSGTGKTWVAHAIAGAVANGQPFVGLETKQLPVLYLDRENPLVVVKRNLDQLGIGRMEEFRIWGGWNEKPPANLNELLEYAEKHRPFLVVDALVRFNPGDEQSAKDTSAFMQPIRQLANLGATVLLLHHTGKAATAKKYRGSSDIEAAVDMAYVIDGKPKNRAVHQLTMKNFKSRFAPGRDFTIELCPGRGFITLESQAIDPKATVKAIILEHPGRNGTEIKALAKEHGLSHQAVDHVLEELPSQPGKGKEKLYYPPTAA